MNARDPAAVFRGLPLALKGAMEGDVLDTSTVGNPNQGAERQLQHWLTDHDPRGATPYAPTGEYCTQYVEDAFKLGAGFDLYGAVKRDMAAHAPGFHLTGTKHDGYRYSSPLAAGKDPYDSDNVAHYFANNSELHAWNGNHGLHAGNVLFLRGSSPTGFDHTAMVGSVDANGHVTKVVESTGHDVEYKTWAQFQHDAGAQGLRIEAVGRADLARSR